MRKPLRRAFAAKRAAWLMAGLVLAVMIALIGTIVVLAWINGGVQPAQMVEIPVDPASLSTGGA